jgi:hypothetical protein
VGISNKKVNPTLVRRRGDLNLLIIIPFNTVDILIIPQPYALLMSEGKKHLAIIVMAIWLFLVLFFMILAQNLDLEIFFILWLVGLLVIVELINPAFVQPSYIRYLKFLVAAGIIVFGAIIAQKVMEILAK